MPLVVRQFMRSASAPRPTALGRSTSGDKNRRVTAPKTGWQAASERKRSTVASASALAENQPRLLKGAMTNEPAAKIALITKLRSPWPSKNDIIIRLAK